MGSFIAILSGKYHRLKNMDGINVCTIDILKSLIDLLYQVI